MVCFACLSCVTLISVIDLTKPPVNKSTRTAEERAQFLHVMVGEIFPFAAILGLVLNHPQKDDDNTLVNVLLNDFNPDEWLESKNEEISENPPLGRHMSSEDKNSYTHVNENSTSRVHNSQPVAQRTVNEIVKDKTQERDWIRKASSGIQRKY